MSATLTRTELHTELGMILDALPKPAILLNTDRRVLLANREYKSRFGAADVEGHPPCYRLLHRQTQVCTLSGESCPLDLCWQTGAAARCLHVHSSAAGAEHVDVTVRPITDDQGRIDSFLQILTPVEIAQPHPAPRGLIGRSRVFNRMLEQITRVAEIPSPALVTGEAGVGKELVAQAIHDASPRAGKPFVPIDCSSLRESIFEREAFGHASGAYPGASQSAVGLIGAAEGGTLFLDEVSELPRILQARFLRLIETGSYRPEGSAELIESDFRVISSTEKDLQALARQGAFRHDLLLILSTVEVHVPALRERTADIALLAPSLLERLEPVCKNLSIHPRAHRILKCYDFPGNVRELQTILEHACLLADGGEILPHHLPRECLRAYERRTTRDNTERGPASDPGRRDSPL